MGALRDELGSGDKRREVIDDACVVLDQEVADKSGLSGIAIKSAYKMVKGLKPGFVRQVVDHLLDEFLDALEPVYQEALSKNEKPGAYLKANSGRVADALLEVTDGKAQNAKSGAIKKTYSTLRPTAKKHVEAAAPRIAAMFDRHAADI